ncbi:MAG: glycosyltransferase [Acetobacter sp.]|nr:glycosyltransferase [Acetobacter sp.]
MIRERIFNFLGITSLMLCAVGIFYFVTGPYFVYDQTMYDLSFIGWAEMLVLWGAGLWLARKGKPFMLSFAAGVTVSAVAFELYRMLMFAQILENVTYIRVLMAVEVFFLLVIIAVKCYELVYIGGGVLFISFFGALFVLPQLCPLEYLYGAAGVFAALWLVFIKIQNECGKKWISWGSLFAVAVIVAVLAVVFYLRQPGIRFYEAKITEPAKDVKVSIIVPVYNTEDKIERCLDSLRKQTLKDIEIIVVDDGSTDGTPEILAKYAAYDARIRVIRQENAYVGMARNRGIAEARAEYVGFVDSDDWVSLDMFEKLYEAIKTKNVNVAMVGKVQIVTQPREEMQEVKLNFIHFTEDGKKLILKLQKPYSGYVWNKLYKKSFLVDNEIYFSPYRTAWEDNYFSILLMAYLDDLTVVEGPIYYYSTSENITLTTIKLSLKDEMIELYVALKTALLKVNDVQQSEYWLEYIRKALTIQLHCYYHRLEDADKLKFMEKCVALLNEEDCLQATDDNVHIFDQMKAFDSYTW